MVLILQHSQLLLSLLLLCFKVLVLNVKQGQLACELIDYLFLLGVTCQSLHLFLWGLQRAELLICGH